MGLSAKSAHKPNERQEAKPLFVAGVALVITRVLLRKLTPTNSRLTPRAYWSQSAACANCLLGSTLESVRDAWRDFYGLRKLLLAPNLVMHVRAC